MDKTLGLHYKALDLHIHTPGSGNDYKESGISPNDIVNKAIEQNLDGICITDHNSGEWIDKINKVAEGKNLVVFPGVEVSVSGGKEGSIHVIGIFEPGSSTQNINDFLSAVGLIADKRGKTDEIAKGDVIEVINAIYEHGALPILAHADSSHGVLHDLTGVPRIKILQEKRLAAAEISSEKYKKVLDGNDPNYKRYLPTYVASDAHCLAEIGTKRSYFKMGNMTLDALRQCFYDGKVRILSEEEFLERGSEKFPQILEMKIRGGFFDNTEITFHQGQNTIIGGQGVGKSLIIEFIRFALNQISPIDQIREDNDSKIGIQLGVGGNISLVVVVESGVRYEVTRTYNDRDNPIVIKNLISLQEYQGNIEELFPIMVYSQTEAVFISRDEKAQIGLIDKLIDVNKFQRRIREYQDLLSQNDNQLAEALSASNKLVDLELNLHTRQELLDNIEKSLQNEEFNKKKLYQIKKDDLEIKLKSVEEIRLFFNEVKSKFESKYSIECGQNETDDAEILKVDEESKVLVDTIIKDLTNIQSKATDTSQNVTSIIDHWLPEYIKVDDEYTEFLSTLGSDLETLEVKRKTLADEISELKDEKSQLVQIVNSLQQITENREQLLDDLDNIYEELFLLRKRKFDELTQLSKDKLNLSLEQGTNRQLFSEKLKEMATGTRIQKLLLETISSTLTPREFVDLILSKENDFIIAKTELSLENVEKLVSHFNNLEAFEQVLELQYRYYPEDVPIILFRMDDGNYKGIREISLGQRCTALLIIALISGNFPIIIDQPEESIDIASVFDDIVNKLRSGKDFRQFILATHNPNIAVTADSDLIHILHGTSSSGEIKIQGAIEDEKVRNEVIQHLEGGEEPYLIRGKKYRIIE